MNTRPLKRECLTPDWKDGPRDHGVVHIIGDVYVLSSNTFNYLTQTEDLSTFFFFNHDL